MLRIVSVIVVFSTLASSSAWAACPPAGPGTLAEAIKDNGQRIVCIQNELATTSTQRSYDFELKSLEQSLQDIQIQRRFDALPAPPVLVPVPVYLP